LEKDEDNDDDDDDDDDDNNANETANAELTTSHNADIGRLRHLPNRLSDFVVN